MAFNQDLSDTPEPQLAENNGQDFDGDVTLQLHITGKYEIHHSKYCIPNMITLRT